MTNETDHKAPVICRILGHAYPHEWVQNIWGGIWVWQRTCRRVMCGHTERIGEVEYERRYAGR
jgi:hypothetical protein